MCPLMLGEFRSGCADFVKVLNYKACTALLNSRRYSISSNVFSLVYLSVFDSRLSNSIVRSCTTFVRRCSCRR